MPQQHDGERPRGERPEGPSDDAPAADRGDDSRDPDGRFGLVPPPPDGASAESPPAMFRSPTAAVMTPDDEPMHDEHPPRARRMPLWAWILIIVAALVTLVLVAAVVIGALSSSVLTRGGSEDEKTPVASPQPTAPAVPINGTFDLEAAAPFDAGPHWEITTAAGWHAVRSDDHGVDEFGNDAGCSFLTSAGPALTERLGAEETASREVFDILESSYDDAEDATDVAKAELDPVWVIPDGAGSVEFLSGRVSYRLDSGEEWTTQFVTRTFTATGTTLHASLQCPSAAVQDGALVSETLGAAEITTG